MAQPTQQKTTSADFSEQDVLVALAKKGIKQGDLAREIGSSQSAVSQSIKKGIFPKVRLKIKTYLNL